MARKKIEGTVVSNNMEKTVIVEVKQFYTHPRYGKRIQKNNRFFAHTESDLEIGDRVLIEETRPISKRKRWRVIETIN